MADSLWKLDQLTIYICTCSSTKDNISVSQTKIISIKNYESILLPIHYVYMIMFSWPWCKLKYNSVCVCVWGVCVCVCMCLHASTTHFYLSIIKKPFYIYYLAKTWLVSRYPHCVANCKKFIINKSKNNYLSTLRQLSKFRALF